MSQDSVGDQWQKLCEEHKGAQNAYLRAFARVKQKFESNGTGNSGASAPGAESSEYEKTRHAWQDVIRRIGEFVKAHD
jgi:hypothetical protein